MPAAKTGTVQVRILLDAQHGEHGRFIAGRDYEVDKKTAEWLLDDPRVAVPVKATGKRETATVDEE